LELDKDNPRKLIEDTNNLLPQDIRLLDFIQVTRSFNSKYECSARTYEFILNLEMLRPAEKHPEFANRDSWVFDEVQCAKFNSILAHYKGSHRFHNFTSKKEFSDPTSLRYIIDISCSPGYSTDGLQLARIRIQGQSFVLHQIRKMIGL
jgi:tRNA pseudouridine38-40 synthase